MRHLAIASILAATIGWGAGCAPKVDCKALKSKLEKCTPQLIWAVKPEERANFEKNTEPDTPKKLTATVEKFRASLNKEVYKPCVDHKGKAKDAKQINECLKKDSCDEFAACFAKYLRSKEHKKKK